MSQMREGWAAIQQTREFDVRGSRDAGDRRHPLLLLGELFRPLYAIDQFVMRGGLLAFVDPVAESDRPMDPMGGMGGMPGARSSDLAPLFAAWGIDYDPQQVIGDWQHALTVSMRAGEAPSPHIAVLALGADSMAQDDVITHGLQTVNVMTAGTLAAREGSALEFEPLLLTSTQSAPIPASRLSFGLTPPACWTDSEPTDRSTSQRGCSKLVILSNGLLAADGAARRRSQEAGDADLVAVMDTDISRTCCGPAPDLGQPFAVAWANNGDLL
jgi:hypothetical protein